MQESEVIAWAALVAAASVGVFAIGAYGWRCYRLHRPSHQYLVGRVPDQVPWQLEYPAEMGFVEAVLHSLINAFLLRDDDTYRLRPDDSLMAIYRAAYPAADIPDMQEFELLRETLQREYDVPATEAALVTQMTVRDVVGAALGARGRRTRG